MEFYQFCYEVDSDGYDVELRDVIHADSVEEALSKVFTGWTLEV